MSFYVIRHPETAGVGTCPAGAIDHYRARGWLRVSEARDEPDDFHLTDYAGAPDLDAEPAAAATPEPELAEKLAKTTKTTTTKETNAS